MVETVDDEAEGRIGTRRRSMNSCISATAADSASAGLSILAALC